jgi:hypothetical protein
MNLIVRPGEMFEPAGIRRLVEGWLQQDYGVEQMEWWYSLITPRLLAEELLSDVNGRVPRDYKFFVIHGEVQMIQVDVDRFLDHKRALYKGDWTYIDCGYHYPQAAAEPRPRRLDEMIEVAKCLGRDFDFARVDLFELPERIVFGEITHCPGSGCERFSSPDVDSWLSEAWTLPKINREVGDA